MPPISFAAKEARPQPVAEKAAPRVRFAYTKMSTLRAKKLSSPERAGLFLQVKLNPLHDLSRGRNESNTLGNDSNRWRTAVNALGADGLTIRPPPIPSDLAALDEADAATLVNSVIKNEHPTLFQALQTFSEKTADWEANPAETDPETLYTECQRFSSQWTQYCGLTTSRPVYWSHVLVRPQLDEKGRALPDSPQHTAVVSYTKQALSLKLMFHNSYAALIAKVSLLQWVTAPYALKADDSELAKLIEDAQALKPSSTSSGTNEWTKVERKTTNERFAEMCKKIDERAKLSRTVTINNMDSIATVASCLDASLETCQNRFISFELSKFSPSVDASDLTHCPLIQSFLGADKYLKSECEVIVKQRINTIESAIFVCIPENKAKDLVNCAEPHCSVFASVWENGRDKPTRVCLTKAHASLTAEAIESATSQHSSTAPPISTSKQLNWAAMAARSLQIKQSDRNTSVQRQCIAESKKAPTPPAVLTNTAPETAGPSRDTAPVGTKRNSPGPIGNRPKKKNSNEAPAQSLQEQINNLKFLLQQVQNENAMLRNTKAKPINCNNADDTVAPRNEDETMQEEKNDDDDDTRNTLLQHSIKLNVIDDSLAELRTMMHSIMNNMKPSLPAETIAPYNSSLASVNQDRHMSNNKHGRPSDSSSTEPSTDSRLNKRRATASQRTQVDSASTAQTVEAVRQ
jgi:hypothetical protein